MIGTGFDNSAIPLSQAKSDFASSKGAGTIIVVGSEGRGLRQSVADVCHTLVTIPGGSQENVDSLNVSATSAILLHQFAAPNNFQ